MTALPLFFSTVGDFSVIRTVHPSEPVSVGSCFSFLCSSRFSVDILSLHRSLGSFVWSILIDRSQTLRQPIPDSTINEYPSGGLRAKQCTSCQVRDDTLCECVCRVRATIINMDFRFICDGTGWELGTGTEVNK